MTKKYEIYCRFVWRICLLALFVPINISKSHAKEVQTDSLYVKLKTANNDSTKADLLLRISRQEMFTNNSKSAYFCDSALKIAQANNFASLEGKAFDLSGVIHVVNGEYSEGIKQLKKAVEIFKKLNDNKSLAKSYGNLATSYQYNEDFENGLHYQLKSLLISEKENDSLAMCISYMNLGNIQLRLENVKRAVEYHKKSYLIAKNIKNTEREVEALNNLSVSLIKGEELSSAVYYTNLSIQIAEENGLTFNMYQAIDILGRIQLQEKKYMSAKNNFLLSKPIFEKSAYEYLIISNYFYLGESYSGLSNYSDSAAFFYHKALNIGLKNKYDVHVTDIYKGLTKLYILNNVKDSAVYYLDKYTNYNFEYLNKIKTKELERLQIKYESTKKEEQILLLKQQTELKDALIVKRNYFITILFLVISIIIIGIFFSYKYLKLHQNKKTGELEHRALRTQMNPHFIFNALNSIQRMYVEGDTDKANDFMADFAQLMRKVLENSGSTKITLQEEVDTLRLYLDLEQLRSKNNFSYTITVDETIPNHEVKIPPLIIQPFVENAIWHGVLPMKNRHGEIAVFITQEQNKLLVSITDNGAGFDENTSLSKHFSKGIQITEQRIGEKVIVKSEIEKGTTVEFSVKIG